MCATNIYYTLQQKSQPSHLLYQKHKQTKKQIIKALTFKCIYVLYYIELDRLSK